MDPEVAWEQMFKAIRSSDFQTAADIAGDLANWLRRGGFSPTVVPELRDATEQSRCVANEIQRHLAHEACSIVQKLTLPDSEKDDV
jgi:hypothetical protein